MANQDTTRNAEVVDDDFYVLKESAPKQECFFKPVAVLQYTLAALKKAREDGLETTIKHVKTSIKNLTEKGV